MSVISIWLLLTVSDGSYNKGNVNVIERFLTKEACESVIQEFPEMGEQAYIKCVPATVLAD